MSELVTYRRFTSQDIDTAHALTVELKWPHRIEDWRFMSDMGNGFVAIDNGHMIGTGLFWHDGVNRASLGMVIVAPDQQGKGIGAQLMRMLIEAASLQNPAPQTAAEQGLESSVIFLHATVAGRPLYEKLGFRVVATLDQHQGTVFQPPLVSLPAGERLRPLGTSDTPRLIELASKAAGLDRSRLLPSLLEHANGIGLDRDGELIGFALYRRFGRGFVLGPVVAPSSAIDDEGHAQTAGRPSTSMEPLVRAKALISYWLARNEGVFIRIDTPGDSGLTEWLETLGLPRVDNVVKMALVTSGDDAFVSLPRDGRCVQFGIVSQALL